MNLAPFRHRAVLISFAALLVAGCAAPAEPEPGSPFGRAVAACREVCGDAGIRTVEASWFTDRPICGCAR